MHVLLLVSSTESLKVFNFSKYIPLSVFNYKASSCITQDQKIRVKTLFPASSLAAKGMLQFEDNL